MRNHVGRMAAALVLVLPMAVLAAAPTAAKDSSGTVFLRTVPALAGVRIIVDSTAVTTGSDGTATASVADLDGVAARVSLASRVLGDGTEVALAKVINSAHTAARESNLVVGLDVSTPVALHLAPGASGVPTSSVQSVRLHSVTGKVLTVDPRRTATVMLLARKARYVAGALSAQPVTWTVDSIRGSPGVALSTSRTPFDPFRGRSWTLVLAPVRGTVIVDTVPKTPGVEFTLEGRTFRTGPQGRAMTPAEDLNSAAVGLRLGTSKPGAQKATILSVSKLAPGADFQRHLLVALSITRAVALSFHDPQGVPVPSSRISEVQLSGGGSILTLSGSELDRPVPLLSVVAKRFKDGWTPQQVQYTLLSVRLEGGNAVFSGQQRFLPSSADHWPVTVSVFDVTISATDVMFGAAQALDVLVTGPDGVRREVTLERSAPTVVSSLVRGSYVVQAQSGLFGSSTVIPVSRDQDVQLRIVTTLDAAVAVVVVLGIGAALVLAGIMLRRRQRSGSS